jgi:hypothetical protein
MLRSNAPPIPNSELENEALERVIPSQCMISKHCYFWLVDVCVQSAFIIYFDILISILTLDRHHQQSLNSRFQYFKEHPKRT